MSVTQFPASPPHDTDQPLPELQFTFEPTEQISGDQLAPFASGQDLEGHAPLENSAPFDGVYNIGGLLFVLFEDAVYEVELDADLYAFEIVKPHRPATPDPEQDGNQDQQQYLQLQAWRLHFATGAWRIRHVDEPQAAAPAKARTTRLPAMVDRLLCDEDIHTLEATTRIFLQEQSAATSDNPAKPHDTRSLFHRLSHALLAEQGAANVSQAAIKGVFESMLRSSAATELSQKLLSALGWFGGLDGEEADPQISEQLVWAALMLELDPVDGQLPGYVAGYCTEDPHHWGMSYGHRRMQLRTHLKRRTWTDPEPNENAACLAAHILTPAMPDFGIMDTPETLKYGTVPWVNFAHGVALATAMDPIRATPLTYQQLVQLALDLSEGATPEEMTLIATTRLAPTLQWAYAHEVLERLAGREPSIAEKMRAVTALDEQVSRAEKAFKAIARETPDRLAMANHIVEDRFGFQAEAIKAMPMTPTSLAKRIEFSLQSSAPYLPEPSDSPMNRYTGRYTLLDVFMAGHMKNGTDLFEPSLVWVQNREEVEITAHRNLKRLEGIDVPALYEKAFDAYVLNAKSSYPVLIEQALSTMPTRDRAAINAGRVMIYSLRSETGKTVQSEGERDRQVSRGRFGFIIGCECQGEHFFYEVFPLTGTLIRHKSRSVLSTEYALEQRPAGSRNIHQKGELLDLDWSAYVELIRPREGKRSAVIPHLIASLDPSGGALSYAALSSMRFKTIARCVTANNLYFDETLGRDYHRHESHSEKIAKQYPPVLQTLEIIVPGLACANALITQKSAGLTCTLDALGILLYPMIKLLAGTVRFLTATIKPGIQFVLPKFAGITASALKLKRARYRYRVPTLNKRYRLTVPSAQAQQYVHNRGVFSTVSGRSGHLSRPGDRLATLGGVTNVPVRLLPNSTSPNRAAYYLINPNTGMAYGPRLIKARWFNPPRRVNGRIGYPMSGRGSGSGSAPLPGPVSGVKGKKIQTRNELDDALAKNGSLEGNRLDDIRADFEDGADLYTYKKQDGTSSVMVHDTRQKTYADVFTNGTVNVGNTYDYKVLKSWGTFKDEAAGVQRVFIDRITWGRTNLDSTRVQSARRAIEEGVPLLPVDVRSSGTGYVVVNGNHRIAAADQLGLRDIPINIVD